MNVSEFGLEGRISYTLISKYYAHVACAFYTKFLLDKKKKILRSELQKTKQNPSSS